MENVRRKQRIVYLCIFAAVFVIEILIALFVRDRFIRPYGGDILVTVLICCFLRVLVLFRFKWLPLWVFLFAAAVEFGQYFHYVEYLGLGEIEFFRVLMGMSFSWLDVCCYAAGCGLFYIGEKLILGGLKKKEKR